MTTDFKQLNLHPDLVQRVATLGYETPTSVQEKVIPMMLEGKDIIAQSETGSGKTAAFALPILQNLIYNAGLGTVQALVLTPTRELAIQVANAISNYGKELPIVVMPVYGGQHYGTSKRRLREGVDVIVGTPGRLQDLMRQNILDLGGVHTVVLDEADEMLSMGFVEDIENILRETPKERQTTLFSATMPKPIRRLADRYMHDIQTVTIEGKQLTVDTVDQRYYLVNERDKLAALTRLFEMEDVTSALIFTRTKAASGHLANELIQRGYLAEALNGDLAQDARMRVMDRFRSGQIQVLVATDVAARGLDIDDISHVFNFDLPNDPEAYVHRIGRTGRAGKEGIAISLVTPGENGRLSRIEHYTRQKVSEAKVPSESDIYQKREDALVGMLRVWLERDRAKREMEIVEEMVAEGQDPVKIAAAALKMARVEEKQRPIEQVNEVQFDRPKSRYERKQNSSRRKGGRDSYRKRSGSDRGARSNGSPASSGRKGGRSDAQEEGMVRLSISQGRVNGISPGEVVGKIASRANIPGSVIGKILIRDRKTLVDVPEEYVSRVLGQNGTYQFGDRTNLALERE